MAKDIREDCSTGVGSKFSSLVSRAVESELCDDVLLSRN